MKCKHFTWGLLRRRGIYYADGRSNCPNVWRHSLGTSEREQALTHLEELDRVCAEDQGIIPRSPTKSTETTLLPLEVGRTIYERYIARSRVTGGVKQSTQKRYRTVFDKFLAFAASKRIITWNAVDASLLNDYAASLEAQGYAHKTLVNELTTIKQTVKWLIQSGHLQGKDPIQLRVHKAHSTPAYCYRQEEVAAMVNHCENHSQLHWLRDVIVTLACTGLRISELASLRWSDLDATRSRIMLTDETGRSDVAGSQRRQLKSGRNRSFPIHSDLKAILKTLPRTGKLIFCGPRGGKLKPDTVRRILVREVIEPLREQFPTEDGGRGFSQGRLHSFRHYFCSTCANSGVPGRIVMDWLGHADSEMIRHYYHLHDEEARRRMDSLDFLGGASGRSADDAE